MSKKYKQSGFIFLLEKTIGKFCDTVIPITAPNYVFTILVGILSLLFTFIISFGYAFVIGTVLYAYSQHDYFAFFGWLISLGFTTYHIWYVK